MRGVSARARITALLRTRTSQRTLAVLARKRKKQKDNRGKISKKIPKRNAGSVREGADNGAIADENAAEYSCGISKEKAKRKKITGER